MLPQFAPCAAHVVAAHPHLLGTPAPPHALGAWHGLPQSRSLPQPSEIWPHAAPRSLHVLGVQGIIPHRFGPPPPQTWGDVQAPQLRVPPHESLIVPQSNLALAQDAAVHPHLLSVPPPPQVTPACAQLPQSTMWPQPSETVPHSAPSSGQVNGVQPHCLETPPPPHVSGGTQ
jgi:hypothetical protein